jgi:hypothetical protein
MFEENLIEVVFAFQDDMLSTDAEGMRFVIPRRASLKYVDQKKTSFLLEFTSLLAEMLWLVMISTKYR